MSFSIAFGEVDPPERLTELTGLQNSELGNPDNRVILSDSKFLFSWFPD